MWQCEHWHGRLHHYKQHGPSHHGTSRLDDCLWPENNATAILDWLDNYTVVEACQDYTVTNNYNGTIPNLCNGGPITVTWTVIDGCGASSTASAEIIVTPDTNDPTDLCELPYEFDGKCRRRPMCRQCHLQHPSGDRL
jgi:hypothetical protein